MIRDLLAFLGTSLTCAAYIAGLGWLARQKILEQHLSRKIMHIGELHLHGWARVSNERGPKLSKWQWCMQATACSL